MEENNNNNQPQENALSSHGNEEKMEIEGIENKESTSSNVNNNSEDSYNQENKKQKLPLEAINQLVNEVDPNKLRWAVLRSEIENWIKENSYAQLKLVALDEQQFQAQFTVGFQGISFQVHLNNETLNPWFITSDSPLLEEYITPLNLHLEDATSNAESFSITNLLNMLAIQYKEAEETIRANQLPHMTNFPVGGSPSRYVRKEEKASVEPTVKDFDLEIIPEIRRGLEQENFQLYEIDEWIRRVSVQVKRGDIKKALQIIRDDILAGNIPDSIRHFWPIKSRYYRSMDKDEDFVYDVRADISDKKFIETGGTSEAAERIKLELAKLSEIDTKPFGFSASPSGNDLFHWNIKLFGFGPTKLAEELTEWSLKHTPLRDSSQFVEQEVVIEMKFPVNFPHSPPMMRVVRPRFENITVDLTVQNQPGSKKFLSVSSAVEKTQDMWNINSTVVDYIQQIRSFLLQNGAKVDINAAPSEAYPMPTFGNFWRSYRAVTPQSFGRPELEHGGKMVLPASALEDLSGDMEKYPAPQYYGHRFPVSLSVSSGSIGGGSNPMLFELCAEDGSGKRSYVGVEEFTAAEGVVCIPAWVLANLGLEENSILQVRRIQLPKGSYVKLQPHTADFLQVGDTKAMLEWVLPKFVAMTEGDTIVIHYREQKFLFNVLEVRPGHAISIIDSDVTTDFAPPLSGEAFFGTMNEGETKDPNTTTTTTTTTTTSNSSNNTVTSGTLDSDPTKVEGVDYQICDNCHHKIPVSSFTMHSISCARNNWFCETCKVVVQKSKKDEHMEEFHSVVFCECGDAVEKRLLSTHKLTECPKRIVRCSYCPLEMPYVELFEHEAKCGSQTEKCDSCGRYIQKRDLLVHMVTCAEEQELRKQGLKGNSGNSPYGSPFKYGGGGIPGHLAPPSPPAKKPEEDLMPCPYCSTPFLHLDDLEVHMLTEHGSDQMSLSKSTDNVQAMDQ